MQRAIPVSLQVVWAIVAVLLGTVCLISTLVYTHGVWLAPLDDVYITLSYAQQLAHGMPFRFNAGDPPSTGATSLLYTCLLAPLAAAAGRNTAALLLGIGLLNTALLWWSCRSIWRLAIQILPPWMAHTAVFALLVSGPVIWGAFCGMDTGLMIALTLAAWEAWIRGVANPDRRWWVGPTALSFALALTRPEGACLALAIGLWAAWIHWRRREPGRCLRSALIGAGAFLLAILPAQLLTGSAFPSSSWAKTAWASPMIPPTVALARSGKFFVDALKGFWMGAYPAEAAVGFAGSAAAENEVIYAFPPAALLLFLLGTFPAAGAQLVAPLGAILWASGFALISLLLPVGWHHHRYLIPFVPPFILLSFLGMWRLAEPFPPSWRRPLLYTLVGGWLIFSLPGLWRHVLYYGRGAESYQAHHLTMARRLAEWQGEGAVAATDVGILKYFTDRKIVDVKGLTAPWLAGAAMRGWGSLYDEFKGQPGPGRPRFAALHPSRLDVNVEQLLRAGVLTLKFSLPHPRLPSEFSLYEFNWTPPGPPPGMNGWAMADEVDCGLAASERAHDYRLFMRSPEGIPYNSIQVRMDSATRQIVGDGGWVLNGRETFTIRAESGEPLILLMRTFAPRPSKITVLMNGTTLEPVPIAAQAQRFQTILIAQLEGKHVRESNDVQVSCHWPDAREYSSYHYWVLQPDRASKK